MAHARNHNSLRVKHLYCQKCGRRLPHTSKLYRVGIALSIVTLGLFIPIWILLHFFAGHWRCPKCNTRRWGVRTRTNPF